MATLPTFQHDACSSLRDRGVWAGSGRHGVSAQALRTYHFIIDFMEMNLADFLHNVFILKSDKAKT